MMRVVEMKKFMIKKMRQINFINSYYNKKNKQLNIKRKNNYNNNQKKNLRNLMFHINQENNKNQNKNLLNQV